jgi:hypothetical protein
MKFVPRNGGQAENFAGSKYLLELSLILYMTLHFFLEMPKPGQARRDPAISRGTTGNSGEKSEGEQFRYS